MEFKLDTYNHLYSGVQARLLARFGIEFYKSPVSPTMYQIDYVEEPIATINTLEELILLQEICGKSIILHNDGDGRLRLEIYND